VRWKEREKEKKKENNSKRKKMGLSARKDGKEGRT
jgi:hypothetical protein